MKLKTLVILLFIAIAFTFAACEYQAEVAAIVNGEEIKTDVLEHRLNEEIRNMELQNWLIEGDEEINELRKSILSIMIEETLFRQAAAAEGITLEPGEVEYELNRIKESFGSEEYFEDDFRERLEQSLIFDRLFSYITKDIVVEEEFLREFYEEYRSFFVTIQVSHILIDNEEEARMLINRLNGGDEFAELARQYSDCPSGAVGGSLLHSFTEHDTHFDPLFVSGAFELSSIGDFSQDPVISSWGYHIILLDDKLATFEELKETIEGMVLFEKRVDAMEEYITMLYIEAEIINFLITEEDN